MRAVFIVGAKTLDELCAHSVGHVRSASLSQSDETQLSCVNDTDISWGSLKHRFQKICAGSIT